MRFPITDTQLLDLGRFVLVAEGAALLAALLLGLVHAAVTRSGLLDSFLLMTFVIFLLFLGYAVLSGPGLFLSRPRLAPLTEEGRTRWRRWLSAPSIGTDSEFFDLVLYTGLGFLLLVIATGIGVLVQTFRG